MSFLLIIGSIILGIIIIAAVFLLIVIRVIYRIGPYFISCIANSIAYKNETEASAWEYWETYKTKHWAELSVEEKEKIVVANLIIANDVGAVVTQEQLERMLEEQLPITEPHVGLSYPMGG